MELELLKELGPEAALLGMLVYNWMYTRSHVVKENGGKSVRDDTTKIALLEQHQQQLQTNQTKILETLGRIENRQNVLCVDVEVMKERIKPKRDEKGRYTS